MSVRVVLKSVLDKDIRVSYCITDTISGEMSDIELVDIRTIGYCCTDRIRTVAAIEKRDRIREGSW